jgi:hypothetical protein
MLPAHPHKSNHPAERTCPARHVPHSRRASTPLQLLQKARVAHNRHSHPPRQAGAPLNPTPRCYTSQTSACTCRQHEPASHPAVQTHKESLRGFTPIQSKSKRLLQTARVPCQHRPHPRGNGSWATPGPYPACNHPEPVAMHAPTAAGSSKQTTSYPSTKSQAQQTHTGRP